ncbi:nicotinate-nucleotide--dimethylbenzimidazole phosphoribosyltransferase [Parvibaculum sp.]|uniref:nicotinate-nucleotide--dimethylbenzimidazole phosphoribosyltransferase n=1 Tax=Parvibaculum sp. TaxID=2024848 RepID=UPI001B22165F|nr:nicotinate-nucleotide--dimethylbenzimidazole phosphoribosyltransferase [Parvibaculum sp.]MBO6667263.1 nicotinate-nucleotide--dimethylbenzimidazole phosphoribosyltransferase [Parvibaculum sp.]MBO6691392.1 nicotinate-nucleotide--dimethylbenzimidazole phosphoribosyltransferase [Parvibaculum sp.]MBO6713816.1 nicotinate-nucleotide--dimethylbenzimidazole phosphoribosyltransferase [Parvibaculum sp.]
MSRAATGMPFDDIRNLLGGLPPVDEEARAAAAAHTASLALPEGSLGRMAELAEWVAGWAAMTKPAVTRPLIAIFAGTHGLAAAIPGAEHNATHRLVELYAAGGGAVNQLALGAEAGLKVFDLALDMPVPDIRTGEALSEAACAATMAFGMEAIAGGTDLLCLGAAGEGGRIAAAALAAALFGGAPGDWTDGSAFANEAVAAALATHEGRLADPLEALRRVGSRELAAIAGAILAARYQRIPVLLDGFVTCAAAAVLHKLEPAALDHCMAAHVAADPAHARLLAAIGKKPLLETGISLEEGAGAALGLGIVKSALAIHGGTARRDQL